MLRAHSSLEIRAARGALCSIHNVQFSSQGTHKRTKPRGHARELQETRIATPQREDQFFLHSPTGLEAHTSIRFFSSQAAIQYPSFCGTTRRGRSTQKPKEDQHCKASSILVVLCLISWCQKRAPSRVANTVIIIGQPDLSALALHPSKDVPSSRKRENPQKTSRNNQSRSKKTHRRRSHGEMYDRTQNPNIRNPR